MPENYGFLIVTVSDKVIRKEEIKNAQRVLAFIIDSFETNLKRIESRAKQLHASCYCKFCIKRSPKMKVMYKRTDKHSDPGFSLFEINKPINILPVSLVFTSAPLPCFDQDTPPPSCLQNSSDMISCNSPPMNMHSNNWMVGQPGALRWHWAHRTYLQTSL